MIISTLRSFFSLLVWLLLRLHVGLRAKKRQRKKKTFGQNWLIFFISVTNCREKLGPNQLNWIAARRKKVRILTSSSFHFTRKSVEKINWSKSNWFMDFVLEKIFVKTRTGKCLVIKMVFHSTAYAGLLNFSRSAFHKIRSALYGSREFVLFLAECASKST